MKTREALHLQPAQAVAQTGAALGCAFWFVTLPFILREMVVRQRWALLFGLPILLLHLNIFLRYSLRAQRVYATDGGLEVFRAGSWRTQAWSSVSGIEQVSFFNSSAIRLFRVSFDASSPPVMFYGNAQTQVRFESLMRQASHVGARGIRAGLSDTRGQQPDAAGPVAVHSPRATRYVALGVRAFLVLCAAGALWLVLQRLWSALVPHALQTAVIALFFYRALITVKLFATREGLLVERRSGERFRVPWSAVGPVKTPAFAAVLPTSMARMYQLRVGAEGVAAFFSNVEGLRHLERHRALASETQHHHGAPELVRDAAGRS